MTKLVEIIATDQLILPGLLFENDQLKTKKIAIWLHGMGDNGVFYRPKLINQLANQLNLNQISFLAFNNRGAHNQKYLKFQDNQQTHFRGGWTNELIIDCLKDIDGAINFAQQQGYQTIYLIGHSTGANKAVLYHYKKQTKDPIRAYILLGASDDVGCNYLNLQDKFLNDLKLAKRMISLDKPFKKMPKYSGCYPMSAQSCFDMLNPDGNYNIFPYYEANFKRLGRKKIFQELNSLDRNFLMIFGQLDEFSIPFNGPENIFQLITKNLASTTKKFLNYEIINQADHSFNGHEIELSKRITTWIKKN